MFWSYFGDLAVRYLELGILKKSSSGPASDNSILLWSGCLDFLQSSERNRQLGTGTLACKCKHGLMFIEHREDPISARSTEKHKAELTQGKLPANTCTGVFSATWNIPGCSIYIKALRVFQSRNYHKMKHLKNVLTWYFWKVLGQL